MGCGEINRPYKLKDKAEKLENPLIQPKDASGIIIELISSDTPSLISDMKTSLISAITSYQIPVSEKRNLNTPYRLLGDLHFNGLESSFKWQLLDEHGYLVTENIVTEYTPILGEESFQTLAAMTAKQLATYLKPNILEALSNQQILENMSIKILQITGAPGDGNKSLRRNIENILKRAKIKIATNDQRGDLVISGAVLVKRYDENQQLVRIDWLLQDHNGREVRSLKQQNLIPTGALSGRWGDIAYSIAIGVVEEAALALDKIVLKNSGQATN